MKTLSRNQSLAAALLAAVTFGLPTVANAGNYNQAGYNYVQCKKDDKNNQIVGGLLGAVAGGVFGSQVAGHGSRTEGSAIGAIVGAAAGAGIGDDKRKCRKEAGNTYSSGQTYGSTAYTYPTTTYRTQPTTTYGSTTSYSPSRTYGSSTYGTTTSYGSRGHQGYSTIKHGARHSYGHQGSHRVDNLRFRIDNLRAERDRLQSRQHRRYSHERAQRIASIGHEMRRLKNRKIKVKKRTNTYR